MSECKVENIMVKSWVSEVPLLVDQAWIEVHGTGGRKATMPPLIYPVLH